jgi:broad specificity phosphatase PhoE
MMQTTRISLIRHGLVYNPQKIYYGRLPRFRLGEEGRSQAAAAAEFLAGQRVTAVYSSPLLRARQTAAIIAARLNKPVHFSRFLLEVHTPYDGRPFTDLNQRNWDVYTGSPPEFEQPADVQQRMVRFIGRIRQRHTGGHAVLVSHADVIAWTVLWAAERPLTIDGRRRLQEAGLPVNYPAYASVTTLAFNGDGERPSSMTYHAPDS